MPIYIAAYDVSDDRARRRVADVLKRYGSRVQRSVFAIRVDRRQLGEIKRGVAPHLSSDDAFDFFPMDERHPERRIRWQTEPEDWEPVIAL